MDNKNFRVAARVSNFGCLIGVASDEAAGMVVASSVGTSRLKNLTSFFC